MNEIEKDDKGLKLEVVPDDEPVEQEKSGPVLVAQFVLIPLLVIAVCVGVFLTFSWLTGEGKTAIDYLNELRYSSGDRRWQAAFELSKFVTYAKDPSIGRKMAPEMIAAFTNARKNIPYDPRIRRYLALALGRVGDAQAVPALLDGLADEDKDTQLYSIWALGLARDDSAIDPLIHSYQAEDPAIRKMSVYVLGNYSGPAVKRTLGAALQDSSEDVRWNAALGLAKQGDSSGKETILKLLDRTYLDKFERLSSQDKADAMINALRAIKILKDPSFASVVTKVAESDPNLSVRQAAIEARKELGLR